MKRLILSLLLIATFAQGDQVTTLGRLQVDWPDLSHPGGAALETHIHDAVGFMSDNMGSRYEAWAAQADSTTVTHTHNLGITFADLGWRLFTGTHPNLTFVCNKVADCATAGWVVAAGASPTTQIDVTAPGAGGPHNFALVTTNSGLPSDLQAAYEQGSTIALSTNAVAISQSSATAQPVLDLSGANASHTGALLNMSRPTSSAGPYLQMVEPGGGSNIEVYLPDVTANWDWTLPPDDGTSGQFLQTDGSGVTTWGTVDLSTKADTNLNNLVSTSVNVNLVPAGNGSQNLGGSSNRWNNLFVESITNPTTGLGLGLNTANASSGTNVGAINLLTGNQSGTANSGNILLQTGTAISGNSGNVTLKAGLSSGGGNGGNIVLDAGTSTSGTPGQLDFKTINATIFRTTGTSNTQRSVYIGQVAGQSATGVNNYCIGRSSCSAGLTGSSNVVMGSFAGDSMTGADNSVTLGVSAGADITTGDRNITIGDSSAIGLATGSENIAIGRQTNLSAAASNQIAIGSQATVTTDNTMRLGNDSLTTIETAPGATIQAEPNAVADASAAGNLIVHAGNKTDGTGGGGELHLLSGTSTGGLQGNMAISGRNINVTGRLDVTYNNSPNAMEVNQDGGGIGLQVNAGASSGTAFVVTKTGGTSVKGAEIQVNSTSGVGLLIGGTSSGTRLSLQGSGGTNGVGIGVPPSASITGHNLILPGTQGAANSFLKNDGSGNLSWAATGVGGETLQETFDIATAANPDIATTTNNFEITSTTGNFNWTSSSNGNFIVSTGGGVTLADGSQGDANQIWASQDANGLGNWVAPDSLGIAQWKKYTKAHTDFGGGGATEVESLVTLPANGTVQGVIIKHSTAFSGGTCSGLTVEVGISGDTAKYASAFDIFQTVGNTVKQSSNVLDVEVASVSLDALFTSTGCTTDIADFTAGAVDIWVLSTTLP